MVNMIEDLTGETLDEAISAPGVLVIDFWASWCGPCRAMSPQLERAAELRPQYRFARVDVDAEFELANRFGIASIPTIMLLRDSGPMAAHSGVIRAELLVAALDRIATGEQAVA